MGRKKPAEPSKNQLLFEKCLLFGAWLLGVLFMLLAVFRYAVDYTRYTPYIKWYALLLVAAVLIYLFYTFYQYPQTKYRIKNFLAKMKSFEQIFMVALFLWFIIVCLARRNIDHYNYFKTLDWWLLDTAVSALVLFPLAFYLTEAKKKMLFDLMLHIVALSYTVFTGWCLWHVFHLNILTLPSENQIGMTKAMELQLGCHYNLTGALSFVILAISCYMMFTKKAVWKIIYGIVALIQLYVSLLTNSRTVFISVLFLGGAGAFLCGWSLLKNRKMLLRLIVGSIMAAVCVLVLWKLRSAVFVLFDSVTNFKALLGSGGQAESAEEAVRDLVGLSGREAIWIGALKIMVSSPEAFFFGLTPLSVPSALQSFGQLSFEPAHAHNIILQVGVSLGVPAMIAFVVFLVRMAFRCIRLFLKTTRNEQNRSGILAIVIASFILLNMAEAYLVAYFSIMSLLFFLACGEITCMDRIRNKKPGSN